MSARCCGDALTVRVVPLTEVPRKGELARPERIDDPQGLLARARAVLDRLQPAYEAQRPAMQDAEGRISPRYHWYLAVTEFLRQTRALAASLADELRGPRRGGRGPVIAPKQGRARSGISRRYLDPTRQVLKEFYAAQDVLEYVKELAAEAEKQPDKRENKLRLLLDRLALADVLSPAAADWPPERALVLIRSIGEDDTARSSLAKHLCSKYSVIHPDWESPHDGEGSEMAFGLECTHWRHVRRHADERVWWEELPSHATLHRNRYCFDVLLAVGYRAQQFLHYEMGTHLFVLPDGRLEPVQTVVAPVAEGQSHWDALLDTVKLHEQAIETVARGEPADAPLDWRPTISVHGPNNFITDLQSGATVAWEGESSPLDRGLMASLPLPPEFADLLEVRGKH